MYRRQILQLGAGGLFAGLAGCSGGQEDEQAVDTPTPKPTPTPTESTTRSHEEWLSLFQSTLSEAEITVDYLAYQGGYQTAALDYITIATTQEEHIEEISSVSAGFTAVVDEGWDLDLLRVGILDVEKVLIGRFHINGQWSRQYNDGEISSEELMTNVLSTLETFA